VGLDRKVVETSIMVSTQEKGGLESMEDVVAEVAILRITLLLVGHQVLYR